MIIDLPTKRVPFPTDEEVWVEEVWLCPLPNFFGFRSQNGEFWCILSRIFTVDVLVYRLR